MTVLITPHPVGCPSRPDFADGASGTGQIVQGIQVEGVLAELQALLGITGVVVEDDRLHEGWQPAQSILCERPANQFGS